MQTLTGHTGPETAYVVADYPYGFRLRCTIRYWLEHKPGHGFRLVSQTSDPKKPGLVWNKPKASTYHVVAVMVMDEHDHVHLDTLSSGGWSNDDRIDAYETAHAAALTDGHRAAIRYVRASNRMNSYVTYTISPSTDGTPRQTREEQQEILNNALTLGYRDVIADEERANDRPVA